MLLFSPKNVLFWCITFYPMKSTHLFELREIGILLKDAVQEKGGACDPGYQCEYKAADAVKVISHFFHTLFLR